MHLTQPMHLVRPWLLAAGSGVALALALPGPEMSPLAVLFPSLLLEALSGSRGWWRAAALGLLAGAAHWAVATNWVVPVMHHYGGLPLAGAVVCLLVMAGLLGLTWSVTAAVTTRVGPAVQVWLLPLAWIAIEAWRQWPPYLFPWNPTAAVLTRWPGALVSLPVWGTSGLGWAVVALGAAGWGLARSSTRTSGAACALLVITMVTTFSILAPAPEVSGEAITVAALQPGTALEERWDPTTWPEIVARVWQQTREAGAAGADLVLWPEGAIPFYLEQEDDVRLQIMDLARAEDVEIVVNSVGNVAGGGYTNAVFLVRGRGVAPERYDKVRLVPFGEYVPAPARWAISDALVREVAGFTPGAGPQLLPASASLGVAICYEVVFADLIAEQVRLGAEVLVTVTNDGWYGFSWAPEQHFAQAVLRAAETRRWLVRAALSGVSGIVDPSGAVVSRLEVGEAGLLLAEVHPSVSLTPRSRWGDWWGAVCAIGSVMLHRARERRAQALGHRASQRC